MEQGVVGRRRGRSAWVVVVLALVALVAGGVALRVLGGKDERADRDRALAALQRGALGEGCGGLEGVAAYDSFVGEAAVARLEELVAASVGDEGFERTMLSGAALCSAYAMRGRLQEKGDPLCERLLDLVEARGGEDPVGALGLVVVCASFMPERRVELLRRSSLATVRALALSPVKTLQLCGLILDRVEAVVQAGDEYGQAPDRVGDVRYLRLQVARSAGLDAVAAVVRVVDERLERNEAPLAPKGSDERRLLESLARRLARLTVGHGELRTLVAAFHMWLGDEARARTLVQRVGDAPDVTVETLTVVTRITRGLRLFDLARKYGTRARERAATPDEVRDATIELRLLQAAEDEAAAAAAPVTTGAGDAAVGGL